MRLFAAALLCLVPQSALAFENVKVDVGLATSAPIFLGAAAVLELPHRIQLIGEIGWLPGPYVDLINVTAEAFNAYDDSTGDLIKSAIKNSLVLRPSVGWRPFENHGWEFMGGYTLAFLGGGVSAVQVMEAATGKQFEASGEEIPISAAVHCFHLTTGWRWLLDDHWVLRANVGYLQAFASHTTIDTTPGGSQARQQAYARLETEVSDYLNDVFKTYVKTPTLGVSLSYRF